MTTQPSSSWLFSVWAGLRALFRKRISPQAQQIRFLDQHELDWSLYTAKYQIRKNPARDYVTHWRKRELVIPGLFDSNFYLENHPDVKTNDVNPLYHFLRHGLNESRSAISTEPSEKPVLVVKKSSLTPEEELEYLEKNVDWVNYQTEKGPGAVRKTAKYFAKNWHKDLPTLPNFFDTKLYLDMYPDIAASKVNPLVHYLKHGRKEGRLAWVNLEDIADKGDQEFDPDKPNLLVLVHETAATGAPIVGLEVARRLGQRYNIITMAGREKSLEDEFLKAAFLRLRAPKKPTVGFIAKIFKQVHSKHPIHCAVASSVETHAMVIALAGMGIPTVALIHEYIDYTVPPNKMLHVMAQADMLVFPAESVRDAANRAFKEKAYPVNEHRPTNIRVFPQGQPTKKRLESDESIRKKLNLDNEAIILIGAGKIQPRKGVEWFFETCRTIFEQFKSLDDPRAERLHFVWLGDGYHKADLGISVWLDVFIRNAGIEDRCHFYGHVDCVATAMSEANLYLLTSRLDPFPNVAIDALDADCSIACFENATGIADFIQAHPGQRNVIAPYGNTHEMASRIVKQFDTLLLKDGQNQVLREKYLNFDLYLTQIEGTIDEALQVHADVDAAMEQCTNLADRFDPKFYANASNADAVRKNFLTALRHGIVSNKPWAGSGIQYYLHGKSTDVQGPDFIALVEGIAKSTSRFPLHSVDYSAINLKYTGKAAIHLHVFFNDLIEEFCIYFKSFHALDIDLFVTHIEPLTPEEVETLENAVSGTTEFHQVPNAGRNVLPYYRMLQRCKETGHDVLGHFHTKKSGDVGGEIGMTWRKYLLQNLAGSEPAVIQILNLFAKDDCGLVFAEDRHYMDESSNETYINQLLDLMDIQTDAPHYSYPLGTMFWSRVAAMEAVTNLDASTFLIPEPIPYDGSLLHAFERIVPLVSEAAGYQPHLIYTPNTYW